MAEETTQPEATAPEAATRVLPDDPLVAGLIEAVPSSEVVPGPTGPGHDVVVVPRRDLPAFAEAARAAGFTTFIDLCAVDYLDRLPRYEVVVVLVATELRRRLTIRSGVPGDDPVAPTITGIFPGANFYEREAFDLFGISFAGHPDLTRILLPDEWVGHPLRKDESVGSVPVQFKTSHKAT